MYDRRMAKKHSSKLGCFECGDSGHFITNCPKWNTYYTKGNGSDSYDSDGLFKRNDYKFRPRKGSRAKNFRKFAKDYQKETKRR